MLDTTYLCRASANREENHKIRLARTGHQARVLVMRPSLWMMKAMMREMTYMKKTGNEARRRVTNQRTDVRRSSHFAPPTLGT